ncbi:MAG TPA: hypothetical protein VKE26_26375 [Xanthobacteraceae bacterium]|nr:hypothetical protein [Xanthobacteraceae bacterium]
MPPTPTPTMPTAADLTASLEALEAAVSALADAYHTYQEQSDEVLHTLPALNAQLTWANTVGAGRVPGLVAGRLRTLGLEPVLLAAKRPGLVGADWVAELTAKLEALVPPEAPPEA